VQFLQGGACLSESHVAFRIDGHADGFGKKGGRVHKGGTLRRVPEIVYLQLNVIAIRIAVVEGGGHPMIQDRCRKKADLFELEVHPDQVI
jgi:hypothetical protein